MPTFDTSSGTRARKQTPAEVPAGQHVARRTTSSMAFIALAFVYASVLHKSNTKLRQSNKQRHLVTTSRKK